MPLVDHWRLYRNGNQLPDPLAYVLTEVLRNMSKVHYDELRGKSSLLAARTNRANNYMRFRVGVDNIGKPLIVIIYHRLSHFREISGCNRWTWGISLGVDPSLTPEAEIGNTNPNDPNDAFTVLADEIIDQVYHDADSPNALGPGASIVIYDHVHPPGATENGVITDPLLRRTTAIGELGWVAEQMIRNDARWDRIEWRETVRVPTDRNGDRIQGWGRDMDTHGIKDTHVVRTTIRPLS